MDIFEANLTLFIIILYKFESDSFEILRDYEGKIAYFKNHIDDKYSEIVKSGSKDDYLDELNMDTFKNIYNKVLIVSNNQFQSNRLENMLSAMFVTSVGLYLGSPGMGLMIFSLLNPKYQ